MKNKVLLGARTCVFPEQIIQLVAQQNYTVIHFKDGSSLLSSTNLGLLEERLQPYSFFRVNRSLMININYLNRFTVYYHKTKTQKVSRKNKNDIFLSRRRIAAFEACVNV